MTSEVSQNNLSKESYSGFEHESGEMMTVCHMDYFNGWTSQNKIKHKVTKKEKLIHLLMN